MLYHREFYAYGAIIQRLRRCSLFHASCFQKFANIGQTGFANSHKLPEHFRRHMDCYTNTSLSLSLSGALAPKLVPLNFKENQEHRKDAYLTKYFGFKNMKNLQPK